MNLSIFPFLVWSKTLYRLSYLFDDSLGVLEFSTSHPAPPSYQMVRFLDGSIDSVRNVHGIFPA